MLRAASPDGSIFSEPTPSREPGAEPFPGYRLIAPLGQGGFGEVWKCEAPGGLLKAIKFVQAAVDPAADHGPAQEEMRAIQMVRSIRHPFLLSMERVELVGEDLVIVMELADQNLYDVLREEVQAGRPGIPRERLLNYLREAAEVLDLMHARYELQHLDIKPQNLFLVSDHLKVGDFGLVNSLQESRSLTGGGGGPPSLHLSAITPLYSAPELFDGTVSRHSDQYSLAIVYQELLTGALPFNGKNSRQLLMQHLQGEPDLKPLPAADRAIIGRALAKDSKQRFPSCSDLIHALTSGQTEVVKAPYPAVTAGEAGSGTVALGKEGEDSSIHGPDAAAPEPGGPGPTLVTAKHFELHRKIRSTPLTEVWEAGSQHGQDQVAKILFGQMADLAHATLLEEMRHPCLLPVRVMRHTPGELMLLTPAPPRTLHAYYQTCKRQGLPGVPAGHMREYLRRTCAALDFLQEKHQAAHLGLNPRALLVGDQDPCSERAGRLLIEDFGLAQLLWLPAGQPVAQFNARYTAPELHAGRASSACDQYSLALMYMEMVTGHHPGVRPSPRELAACLDRLPEAERAALARALDPDPGSRWESCTGFAEALLGEGLGEGEPEEPVEEAPPSGSASGTGSGLYTRFGTVLTVPQIRERLEGFRAKWEAELTHADEAASVFLMKAPRNFWQRWTGRQPSLMVTITLSDARTADSSLLDDKANLGNPLTVVAVAIAPRDCPAEQSEGLVQVVAPLLVESVRRHLQVDEKTRREERLVWHSSLLVYPVNADGGEGEPVECQGKDISLNGIGFYLPGELGTTEVRLEIPQTAQTRAMSVPAHIVRMQKCVEGWYEIGAILLHDDDTPLDRGTWVGDE